MKKALLIAVVMGLAVLSNAQVYTQTYSAGDINGVGDVQTSTAQTSPCPGVITFTGLPAGIVVDSVNVVYDFFSTMAGFQSPFDQRSYIRCTTTGISESTLALANVQGIATVANYNRTISIANGPLTSTTLTFELHAGTTSLIPGSCTGSGHLVLNNSWTVTVYTSGSATCAAPSNLAASATSASSVTLDWTPGGSETQWEVQYGLANGSAVQSVTVNAHPHTVSNLDSATSYEFYVRAICAAGDSSLIEGPLVVTTDTPACAAPTNLMISGITQTEATLGWTASGFSVDYVIEFGPSGFTPGTGAGTVITGAQSNPWLLTGLSEGMLYDAYVRKNCGLNASDFAGPVSFETLPSDIGLSEWAESIQLYPNPATDRIFVEAVRPMDYAMFSAMGVEVMTGSLSAGPNELKFTLSPGWYLLRAGEVQLPILVVE